MAQTHEGAMKTAAKCAGMAYEEYVSRRASGEKFCQVCRVWHPVSEFGKDSTRADGYSALCIKARSERYRARYVPKVRTKAPGPAPNPPRDDDKLQARQRVNLFVKRNKLPNPNSLPCFDCGHAGDDQRHEYDHYLGYAAEHHMDVQAVCRACHTRRTEARGEVDYSKRKGRKMPVRPNNGNRRRCPITGQFLKGTANG